MFFKSNCGISIFSAITIIIIIIIISFSHQLLLIVFHWILGDSKSAHVSRNLLSILVLVWVDSIRSLIFNSSELLSKPLRIVPSAPITIGITITHMFPCFFQFSCKAQVVILLFVFCGFYYILPGQQSPFYDRLSYIIIIIIVYFTPYELFVTVLKRNLSLETE